MSVFRHGDDFVVSGTRAQQQKEFEEQLSKHLIVKHLATLEPCTALGDVTEVKILNRVVRWVKPPYGSGRERIEYEADPRHAELIIHQLWIELFITKCVHAKSKPGVDLSSVLNSADHTLFRWATMRLCYLALDRLDLQFPSKELARWIASTDSWKLGGPHTGRQILDWTWTIDSGVCATSRGTRLTLWCSVTQITQIF